MKLLMFQARRFAFRPFSRHAPGAADAGEGEELREVAVVFTHTEAADESAGGRLVSKAVKNIKWLANKRALKNIVLHSFSHLSSSKSTPEFARETLEAVAARLTGAGYHVVLTPFGYTCEWQLDCYGESLAKVYKEL